MRLGEYGKGGHQYIAIHGIPNTKEEDDKAYLTVLRGMHITFTAKSQSSHSIGDPVLLWVCMDGQQCFD